jgi:molecular chaperone HtpG
MTTKETMGFQTEVKQLLHLMINALYSNKEIFLRELISNSADAVDKLRFSAVKDSKLLEGDAELGVRVKVDEKAKTVTISDNGIGMSRDDVINNLGTIAKSGTKEFLSSLSGDQAKDSQLIGQFGVGFYSAFIVADKVTVETRKAGSATNEAVRWESTADGDYTVETIEKATRGTDVILHLKKEDKEFLEEMRLRNVIKKYSDHINLPVIMKISKQVPDDSKKVKEGEMPPMKTVVEDEVINEAKALWTLSKSEIKDDEYKEFYKHISHDYSDPMAWSHNKVEGKLDYTTLLYLPTKAPFNLYDAEQKHGLKLYIQRVFIMDEAENFLPRYLRFIRGVVDCKDLPLNVSREILQRSVVVDKIRAACIKRSLAMIEKIAKEADKYAEFWGQFGNVLKEGVVEDQENKEKIAKLLRFATTNSDTPVQNVSLDAYLERMPKGQEKIYYLSGESFNAVKNSPHLEVFRKKGIEVLLLTDRVDEWLTMHLTEYEGKTLQSVAKGELDLGGLHDKEDKNTQEKLSGEFESTIKQIKETLGDKVQDVRLTHRLTDSPACVVLSDNDMGGFMQQMMQQMGQSFPMPKPIFEINPEHALVQQLKNTQDDEQFKNLSLVLLDQAILAEGGKLDDPAAFVRTLNTMLLSK